MSDKLKSYPTVSEIQRKCGLGYTGAVKVQEFIKAWNTRAVEVNNKKESIYNDPIVNDLILMIKSELTHEIIKALNKIDWKNMATHNVAEFIGREFSKKKYQGVCPMKNDEIGNCD